MRRRERDRCLRVRRSPALTCALAVAGLGVAGCQEAGGPARPPTGQAAPQTSALDRPEPDEPPADLVPPAVAQHTFAYLQDDFELVPGQSSAQRRKRIARVLARAAPACMGPKWKEWVCRGRLELEVVVHPGKKIAHLLRSVGDEAAPRDAAVSACLDRTLAPLGELGFEERVQIVHPIAVMEAFVDKAASGCGDDPTHPGFGHAVVPEPGSAAPPAVSTRAPERAIPLEDIRRHVHRQIAHCRNEDPVRWREARVTMVELWIDPTGAHASSDPATDLPVILLTHDGTGMVEVRGPVLDCMTEQAASLIALSKQHGEALRVTYPMLHHGL